MSAALESYEGSCLCGKVRYRVGGATGMMDHCHCTDCRKSHGAAFATYLEVPRKSFELTSGQGDLETYTAASGTKRSFCRRCGSNITCWTDADPAMLEVAAGTLDTPITKRPRSHTFVRSKVDWFEIQDGLPQHATSRDET